MTWLVSICLYCGFSAAATIWERILARRTKLPMEIPPVIAFGVGGTLVGVSGALWFGDIRVEWGVPAVVLLVVEGALIGGSFMLAFKALRYLMASRYQVISQLASPVSIVLGMAILGEVLVGMQYLAAAMLVGAAFLAAMSTLALRGTRKLYSHRGLVLAVLSALCMGAGMVAEKALLGYMSASAYFIFGFGAQSLALLVFAWPKLRANRVHIRMHDFTHAIGYGAVMTSGGLFYVLALQQADNLPLVAAAASLQMPVGVLACILFLGERRKAARIVLAVGLALGGMLLLAFG